jgi:hypothetical protein
MSETERMPTAQKIPSHRRGLFFVMFQENERLRERPRRAVAKVESVRMSKNLARLKRVVTNVGRSVSMVKKPAK